MGGDSLVNELFKQEQDQESSHKGNHGGFQWDSRLSENSGKKKT